MTPPTALQQHAQSLLNRFIRQSAARRGAVHVRRGLRPTRRGMRARAGDVDAMLHSAARRVNEPLLQVDIRLLRWLLPRAAEIMNDNAQLSQADLQKLLHRQVMEFSFIDECGDHVFDDQVCSRIDHQVELVVRILDHARRKSESQGAWTNLPPTPMMFG